MADASESCTRRLVLQSPSIMAKDKPLPPNLDALEKAFSYTFTDRTLLERAVTHRSWAHERVNPGEEEKARHIHNEALEFVGDSVLGLVVAVFLLDAYPDVTEGELSRMKHRLVSTHTLARAAKNLNIGDYLRFGRGEEKTGGRRKRALLADAFEAVLAAIYIDGGIAAATDFIHCALGEELAAANPEAAAAADFKTMLQERLQAEYGIAPQYVVIETQGPPHRRTFRVEVRWEGGQMKGEGCSIKAAEMEAAHLALKLMDTRPQTEAAG